MLVKHMKVYERILRPLLFSLSDPEKIHKTATYLLKIASTNRFVKNLVRKKTTFVDPALQVNVGQMVWQNPIGLAAGFDKDIHAPHAYSMLGFGSVEFGSITFEKQPGNPKPRLWRIPKDKGLIVNYGLANNGALNAAKKLQKFNTELAEDSKISFQSKICYGVSIAPTTKIAFEHMAEDYAKTFDTLSSYADYITLNISCPNVASASTTLQLSFIEELLSKIYERQKNISSKKDIFIKIGAHHTESELDRIIVLAQTYALTGIIATNLLKQKQKYSFNSSKKELSHPGGISGLPVQNVSDETIKYLYKKTDGKLCIIGVGGIFTAEDAYRKIKYGANALQIITGFIYGGPLIVRTICEGLVNLLKNDGFKSISEAVGKDVEK
jgi:dihydroorotate dehydrogenase